VVSNLKRLVDIDKIISEAEFKQVIRVFLGEIAGGVIYTLDVTPKVVLPSVDLCLEHYLTQIDALQLAAAFSNKSSNPVFVCSDLKLVSIAEMHGLQTLNLLTA
jgi:predicted nucleic acid-binding protein